MGVLGHWLQASVMLRSTRLLKRSGRHVFLLLLRAKKHASTCRNLNLIKRKISLWNWSVDWRGYAWSYFLKAHLPARWALPPSNNSINFRPVPSGLLCDRFGVGVGRRKYFTPWRITGALTAVTTILSCRHSGNFNSFILLAISLWCWLLAGSLREMRKSPRQRSMLVSITWNLSSAFVSWRGAAMYRIGPCHYSVT